ncbi:hypothetical protein pb186bvf_003325 [Paramecium bursaria]
MNEVQYSQQAQIQFSEENNYYVDLLININNFIINSLLLNSSNDLKSLRINLYITYINHIYNWLLQIQLIFYALIKKHKMIVEDAMVQIQSSEGKITQVEKIVISKSLLIKSILEDFDNEVIPLPFVPEFMLTKVVNYCLLHMDHDEPKFSRPLEALNISQLIEQRYDEYINDFTKVELIDLINVASYLDIPSLLELACGKLASIMKQMSKEELIKGFGLVEEMVAEKINQ